MLSSDVAVELAVGILLIGAVIGVAIGALASLALRRSWGMRAAIWDFVLAALVTVAVGFALTSMPSVTLEFMPIMMIVWGSAACSVILLHVVRVLSRSKP
jgi:hypothetical protein